MTRDETSSKGVISLVFGILGLVGLCPLVGPIVAIVTGAGETDGVGRAGYILGWIGVGVFLITVVGIALWILLFGGIAVLTSSG